MRLTILILLCLTHVASYAATLTGRTVRVTDGDTIVGFPRQTSPISRYLGQTKGKA